MRILQARPEHLDLLTPLFIRFRESKGEDTLPDSSRKFLETRLKRNESIIYLALAAEEDQLLGFCQLYPSYSSLSLKRVWLINDLYVAEQARRQLVADHLLQTVKQMAIDSHSVRLRAMCPQGNNSARALYESVGFKDDLRFTTLTLELDN